MTLIILHYHLRPGGIRRVIELATPHLVESPGSRLRRVVLAAGEEAESDWLAKFQAQLGPVPLELRIAPTFGYLSEQRGPVDSIRRNLRDALDRLLSDFGDAGRSVVWAHNLGIARNPLLSRELTETCERHGVRLLSHHHDWWFDNRWHRWPEMRRCGIRTLAQAAATMFPSSRMVHHLTINESDGRVLRRHLPGLASWLPNLTEPSAPPAPHRARAAARWLANQLGTGAPVWLVPCRLLRRKNLAEALLLTRWLRPEAWLVTTGGISSAEEAPYARRLQDAARRHGWPLRLSILARAADGAPTVPELLAACECVLLTSVQEGFGLPYLEAAASGRPLIARELPNIRDDLRRFGFRYPQNYQEVLVPSDLFDPEAEARRQARLHHAWRRRLPGPVRPRTAPPPFSHRGSRSGAVAFSRLTLEAQLEVLARPAGETWERCAPLNPFLRIWRERAAHGSLQVPRWPARAGEWLSGRAYARRWLAALRAPLRPPPTPAAALAAQEEFLSVKLGAENSYPLLWNGDT